MVKKRRRSSPDEEVFDARLEIRVMKVKDIFVERQHWNSIKQELDRGGGYIAFGSRTDSLKLAPDAIADTLRDSLSEQVEAKLLEIDTALKRMFGMIPGGWPKEYDAT